MNDFHVALSRLIYNEDKENFEQQLYKNIEVALSLVKFNTSKISKLKEPFNDSIRWKYISLAFDILLSLENNETVISINYINDIRNIFQLIVSLGILPNLIPGIGINIEKRKNYKQIPKETLSVQEQYYRLSGTLKGLLLCLKIRALRNFLISNHFNDLLAGLLQLNYAPVKKPSCELKKSNEFQMTDDFYNEILADKKYFQFELNQLLTESYTPQLFKELMLFYGNPTSPKWLKISVYKILISKLMLNDGVESLIKALCDANIDTGSKWQQCNILVKLLLTKPNNFDENNYYTNICGQIMELLTKKYRNNKPFEQYEIIVSICIKYLFEKNTELCYKYFLIPFNNRLLQFSKNNIRITENLIFTQDISQIIIIWYNCVVQTSGMVQSIPINCMTPIINLLFQFYVVLINNSIFKKDAEYLSQILIKHLNESDNKNQIFESLLFEKKFQEHLEIIINENNDIEIKTNPTKIHINSLDKSDSILNLLKNSNIEKIILPLCIYLLEISIEDSSKKQTNPNHLRLENEELIVMDETTERKLIAYNLLSNIVNNPNVHTYLQKNPVNIFNFIEKTLISFTVNKLHKSLNCDSEQYQHMFLLIMIVNIISVNENLSKYTNLKNVLNLIYNETPNSEMKNLIRKIYDAKELEKSNTVKSDFDKALEDVCDPLLPVRGHGLMTIAKLLEEKNDEACSQKQYILNLCQQHIKDEDSYIYLNAIKVLATLGDSFPDIIINILTDEYTNGCKDLNEKNNETRMKLGEVLLRVVKKLGDNAPKYKSILLNTFLSGVRDEDHLIRASSLSILGEICRVLGYKLGSVVNEVLSCIHAVIANDKAVEARRAAVSVIRWLFVGLEKDTIVFLKDDILPIYRTLKMIYTSDPDDITRLQAQLALEELNANMRDFIFPKVLVDKKIVMLQ